jgi:negative regulator of flagellin synthesis FlgM
MNVNSNLQVIQQLFSNEQVTGANGSRARSSAAQEVPATTDEATLSPAASLAALSASDSDVRLNKVAQVQEALAAGTYNIPSAEVAGKIIDHMLEN